MKVTMLALGLVVLVSALGAASASAGWLINGTSLATGAAAALNTQALVDEESTLLIPVLKIAIKCNGHFLDGLDPLIIGPNKGFASALTFLGCSTITPPGCELKEQPTAIATNAILATAAKGPGESVRAAFTPETTTTFAHIFFAEANECAFKGNEPVTGSLVAGGPTGQLSLLAQALVGLGSTEGNNSLQIAGDKSFLDGGSALLTLASDSKWSFD
jgi:hypothetical protein